MNLSIIIATYNAAKTLCAALDSVLNQTYQDWECLVVDGASSDNTLEIVKKYALRDKRIRYISEPDKGIYDAFNKGWRLAKGEWIYYLGADDILLPDGMAEIFRRSWTEDVVYGDMYFKNPRGIIKKQSPLDLCNGKFKMVSHQSLVMRRCVIEKMGGFDTRYKISADYDLLLRALLAGYKYAHCDAYVAQFTTGGLSSTNMHRLMEIHNSRKRSGAYGKWQMATIFLKYGFVEYARLIVHKIFRYIHQIRGHFTKRKGV
ncbi:MAG: glycosyltransferase [Prevotella sp.]|nr:glycosyltransferase [Prevotella sp.]